MSLEYLEDLVQEYIDALMHSETFRNLSKKQQEKIATAAAEATP